MSPIAGWYLRHRFAVIAARVVVLPGLSLANADITGDQTKR